MGIFVDIFFVVVSLIIIIVCTARGFVKTAIQLVSFILSLVIAILFCSQLAGFIAEKWLDRPITDKVEEKIASLAQKADGVTYDLSSLFGEKQPEFFDLLTRYRADKGALEQDYGTITDGTQSTVRDISKRVSAPIVKVLSYVIAFAILFIGSALILLIVSAILNSVAKLPVLKQLNGFLGFLCGVILAAAFVFVFSTVAVYLFEKLAVVYPDTIPSTLKEDSIFLKYCSDFKVLAKLFS